MGQGEKNQPQLGWHDKGTEESRDVRIRKTTESMGNKPWDGFFLRRGRAGRGPSCAPREVESGRGRSSVYISLILSIPNAPASFRSELDISSMAF